MSIKIQITPKELQELEQNGSALFALFKVAMENQNMNRLNLAGDSVKESKKPSSKVKRDNAKAAANKVKAENLKITHQLLAEIIRNSTDLLSVKAKAKESSRIGPVRLLTDGGEKQTRFRLEYTQYTNTQLRS